MKRQVITTADGSKTIQITDWNEQYHSIHGALQEANHVYIKHGFCKAVEVFNKTPDRSISLLEIGFGTGLNAILTFIEAENKTVSVSYTGVEAYPVFTEELKELNYSELFNSEFHDAIFNKIHDSSWEIEHNISSGFKLLKHNMKFQDISFTNAFDLIYFDAFGARVQPELWTESIFEIMFKALKEKGVLVTYSAKGSVRRSMQAVGFTVERLPGPPGKREMLRAQKNIF